MGSQAEKEYIEDAATKGAVQQTGVEWFDRGSRLLNLGTSEEAVSCFANALRAGINDPAVHNNMGNAYIQSGRFDEAIAAYLEALHLRPTSPKILTHLGVAFMNVRLVATATACLDRAVALDSAYPSAHWNRGLLSLLKGDYQAGWAEYEWRWKLPHVKDRMLRQLPPRWDGRKLNGENVLVYAEQGLGDTLQFVRFIPEIASRGGNPILYCQPELESLLGSRKTFGTVVGTNEPMPRADYSIALLSLPAVLQIGGKVAVPAPYLAADAGKVERWRSRLAGMRGLKVGVVWAGKARIEDVHAASVDKRRSLSLKRITPLLQVPGCTFISLQKGPPQQELSGCGLDIIDSGNELMDFSDAAALVENLDLVISVDTSVVHLCGALGRPVWMLSRHDGCWRWLLEGSGSPWYPTLKIFRQHSTREWDTVVDVVANELRNLALRQQGTSDALGMHAASMRVEEPCERTELIQRFPDEKSINRIQRSKT